MRDVLDAARDAAGDAYAPYSSYPVGAALLTADGTLFTGCNVEVANFSNTLHAEELALGRAVQRGFRSFEAIAVWAERGDGLVPCGSCRQSLAEFCGDDLLVLASAEGDVVEYTLGELLPAGAIPGLRSE